MARRTSLFEDFAHLPWSFGVAAAAIVFIGSRIYAAQPQENVFAPALATLISTLGTWFSLFLLLAALLSLVSQLINRHRFNATQSPGDIRALTWRQFESYIGELFRRQCYLVIETPECPDSGVDLVLRKDGEKTYVQCKHGKTYTVGVEKIRKLLGRMAAGGAQCDIFFTSGRYSQTAKDLSRDSGRLIGGAKLESSFENVSPTLATERGSIQSGETTFPQYNASIVKWKS